MDQRIARRRLVKKILVLSIHIAATATDDIDLAICIAPSRVCILKPSICIAGQRRNMLNEKYRITYRIVQGVEIIKSSFHRAGIRLVNRLKSKSVQQPMRLIGNRHLPTDSNNQFDRTD